jgi:hypothetical protein
MDMPFLLAGITTVATLFAVLVEIRRDRAVPKSSSNDDPKPSSSDDVAKYGTIIRDSISAIRILEEYNYHVGQIKTANAFGIIVYYRRLFSLMDGNCRDYRRSGCPLVVKRRIFATFVEFSEFCASGMPAQARALLFAKGCYPHLHKLWREIPELLILVSAGAVDHPIGLPSEPLKLPDATPQARSTGSDGGLNADNDL